MAKKELSEKEKEKTNQIIERMKEALGVATVKDMLEKMDVPRGTYDGWKQRGFSKRKIFEIASILKVDPEWLENGGASVVMEQPVKYGAKEMSVPVLNPKASAGGGNNIESIDVYESGKRLTVDPALFPVPPGQGIRAIQVDGYSMVPVLLPGSWVFFKESREWSGDGLYVLVFRGVLMVKQVVADVKTGNLWIKSANPDYESWEYDPTEDQSTMRIVGRVVRVMM